MNQVDPLEDAMNAKPGLFQERQPCGDRPGLPLGHDMHAYYGESYIVQGVSFNVHEGEILALLGRNGAGKTSTLRAIARLGQPGR
jgi:branched-chain amino acid transport system ATP-binding protein